MPPTSFSRARRTKRDRHRAAAVAARARGNRIPRRQPAYHVTNLLVDRLSFSRARTVPAIVAVRQRQVDLDPLLPRLLAVIGVNRTMPSFSKSSGGSAPQSLVGHAMLFDDTVARIASVQTTPIRSRPHAPHAANASEFLDRLPRHGHAASARTLTLWAATPAPGDRACDLKDAPILISISHRGADNESERLVQDASPSDSRPHDLVNATPVHIDHAYHLFLHEAVGGEGTTPTCSPGGLTALPACIPRAEAG